MGCGRTEGGREAGGWATEREGGDTDVEEGRGAERGTGTEERGTETGTCDGVEVGIEADAAAAAETETDADTEADGATGVPSGVEAEVPP